jgi:hypothetical protein
MGAAVHYGLIIILLLLDEQPVVETDIGLEKRHIIAIGI